MFSKAKTKLSLSLHYNGINSYLPVNGKAIYKFKADYEIVNFPTQFYLGSIFNKFDKPEDALKCRVRRSTIKKNVYHFSVDCVSIHISEISKIHKYLMIGSNMK